MARERIAEAGEPTDHRTIYVTVTPEVHDRVRRLSERSGKPMSWHGREALSQYLARQRRERG